MWSRKGTPAREQEGMLTSAHFSSFAAHIELQWEGEEKKVLL